MILSVVTWTKQVCGCLSSDDRWWIVDIRCALHRWLVPADDLRAITRSRRTYGNVYGPVEGR